MNAFPLRATCAAAALAASLLASGCAAMAEGRSAPPVSSAPSDWIGGPKDARSLPKNRWTLIVIFRPGSQTCADGIPEVLALKKKYAPQGLSVVGITAADREDAEAFVKDNKIDFPVLVEANDVVDSYGIPAVDENYTYLIDPPGVVIAQCDLPATRSILDRYLKK